MRLPKRFKKSEISEILVGLIIIFLIILLGFVLFEGKIHLFKKILGIN